MNLNLKVKTPEWPSRAFVWGVQIDSVKISVNRSNCYYAINRMLPKLFEQLEFRLLKDEQKRPATKKSYDTDHFSIWFLSVHILGHIWSDQRLKFCFDRIICFFAYLTTKDLSYKIFLSAKIDDLPREILCQIFKHLRSSDLIVCSVVNKRWS